MEADKRKRAPKAVQALAGTTTLLCHEISPSLVLTPYLLPCPQSSLLALAALNCERLPLQSEDVLPVPPGEERSGVRAQRSAASSGCGCEPHPACGPGLRAAAGAWKGPRCRVLRRTRRSGHRRTLGRRSHGRL
jgi:hypothetical protein